MLLGEFRHTMDVKNRIFIPAKFREELGEKMVLAIDIHSKHCIKVYSTEGWDAYTAPIKQMERSKAEMILRLLNASAAQVTPDAQGRVVITPELVAFAGIAKEAVVVGCGDYAEIWNETIYDDQKQQTSLDELCAILESVGL